MINLFRWKPHLCAKFTGNATPTLNLLEKVVQYTYSKYKAKRYGTANVQSYSCENGVLTQTHSLVLPMGTGIGYRNEARARMKGWYGTGKICKCLTSLIKTIGGEFPVRQRNANHNYAYTRLQHILSQDSSRASALSSVSCTGVIGKVQKLESLELYAYLTLF